VGRGRARPASCCLGRRRSMNTRRSGGWGWFWGGGRGAACPCRAHRLGASHTSCWGGACAAPAATPPPAGQPSPGPAAAPSPGSSSPLERRRRSTASTRAAHSGWPSCARGVHRVEAASARGWGAAVVGAARVQGGAARQVGRRSASANVRMCSGWPSCARSVHRGEAASAQGGVQQWWVQPGCRPAGPACPPCAPSHLVVRGRGAEGDHDACAAHRQWPPARLRRGAVGQVHACAARRLCTWSRGLFSA
jgi:hypothetical protein